MTALDVDVPMQKPLFNGKGRAGKLRKWRLEKKRRIRDAKNKKGR